MNEFEETIETEDGPMGVHVVRPDGDGPFPVVVSFHHGPGLDAGSKEAMRLVAGWGYQVVSHDRYHRTAPWLVIDRSTATEEEQRRFGQAFAGTTEDLVATDVAALVGHLEQDPAAKAAPMGCIGYCIGGRSVLRTLATDPERFRVGVALHPSMCTTDGEDSPHLGLAGYDGAIYVAFGAEDRVQPAADNQPFLDLVRSLPQGEAEIHEGANHGFAVPSFGWYETAAARSYERARALFDAHLR